MRGGEVRTRSAVIFRYGRRYEKFFRSYMRTIAENFFKVSKAGPSFKLLYPYHTHYQRTYASQTCRKQGFLEACMLLDDPEMEH